MEWPSGNPLPTELLCVNLAVDTRIKFVGRDLVAVTKDIAYLVVTREDSGETLVYKVRAELSRIKHEVIISNRTTITRNLPRILEVRTSSRDVRPKKAVSHVPGINPSRVHRVVVNVVKKMPEILIKD